MKKILALILLMMVMGSTHAETVTMTSDADTWLRGGQSPKGSDGYLDIMGYYDFSGIYRFDLSSLGVISISDASLTLTVTGDCWRRNDTFTTGRLALFGMNNVEGNTPQDWDEATFTADMSGAEWTGVMPMDDSVANGRVVNLDADNGANTVETGGGSAAAGTSITLSGDDLVTFLQSRVFDGGLASFFAGNPLNEQRGYGLATKEYAVAEYHPVLEITYEPIAYAYLPQPEDEASVSLDISELSWSYPPSEGTVTCDVYFGTEEPNALLENYGYDGPTLTGVLAADLPIAIPVTVQPSTTYYWVVDCTDSATGVTTPGKKVWSFYVSGAPELVTDLAGTAEFEGTTAVLSTSFTTDAALVSGSPKWYMVGETDTEVSDSDADITISLTNDSGVYTSALEIANLDAADEAEYYCVIENSNGPTQTSTVKLIVKRELAHFTFDTDPNDVLGNFTGQTTGSPTYETGKVGNAIVFDGEEDYITLSEGFEDFTAGMTISVWAYPTAVNNWARFIDFGTGNGNDDLLFSRYGTTNTLSLRFNDSEAVLIGDFGSEDTLELNVWQMFVVTIDAAGNIIIYKDGLPVLDGALTDMPTVAVRTSNFIGKSNWESDSLYAGMMDDMHIYNYAITDDDVADMYAAVEGDFCRERPEYDLTGDCKVDVYDLSYLVSYWLDCGFYPNPACE